MIKEESIETAYDKTVNYSEEFCRELIENGVNKHTVEMMLSAMKHAILIFKSDIYHESTMDFIKNSILWSEEEKQKLTE